jgi:adenine-specific DNA-methyltransferase
MKQITIQDPEARSTDIVADNVDKLRALFPELITEGPNGASVDIDVLKQLVGDQAVTDADEKYGLTWHGKRAARRLALTPSTGTLRPAPEESVNWDSTRNLMIEGDNLEVLKLLQKSYAGKVKLIYIDPPYNTGKDFVYKDDFRDSIRRYKEVTGQVEAGEAITSNTEASGRFHTDWLNLLHPRLRLARNLLSDDGLIFVSIDDGELAGLRKILDEIFGEEEFLASFIWKSRQQKDNRTVTNASVDHEYIVCYGSSIRGADRDRSQYSNPDNDPRGAWTSANMVGIATADRRPNLHYDLVDPETGINYGCPDMGWRYDRNTMGRLIEEKRILWPSSPDGRPRRKAFLDELESEYTGFSTIVGEGIYTKDGTADIDALFGERVFDFPKPVRLITSIVEQGAPEGGIVLDFFSGSGTAGHAVMEQNAIDGKDRRYILVQLPEPLDTTNRDKKTAAACCDKLGKPRNIAELTKERLRRAARKVKTDYPNYDGDLGFRVHKLDSSNIHAWKPNADDLDSTLLDHVEHIKSGRTEQDVLTELLLKLGLDLCVPIETQEIAGKTVHSVGAGTLFVSLPERVAREEAEALAEGIVAWCDELSPVGDTTVVFRDSAFADDVAKANATAILEQHGIKAVRSL